MDYTKYSKAELLTLCQVYKAKIDYLEGVNKQHKHDYKYNYNPKTDSKGYYKCVLCGDID